MRPKCNLTNSASRRGAPFEKTDAPTRKASPKALLLVRHVCLGAALAVLAALAFVAYPARAAVTEAWVQRYNHNVVSNSTDQAIKVVCDAAGDIIVAGNTDEGVNGHDMLTIKYSGADGSVLWQKRYNGPTVDYAEAVAVDTSGNVVVTGSSGTDINDNGCCDSDYYTAKYAATDGALLWERRYNGPANGDDRPKAVAADDSGNVVVTGSSYGGRSYYDTDYYTAKYAAADGALLWEKRYNSPANGYDRANAVAVDASGNVVVTGTSFNGTNSDYYTAMYAAADGALLWERRYSGPGNFDDQAHAMAGDATGNVVVTGYDYYTAKYAAANGELIWERRGSPGGGSGGGSAVTLDGSGNVVVTGYSVNATNFDYYTAKYAGADGALLWEKRYNGPANGYDE